MEKQEVEILFRKHYRRMYAVAFGLLYDGQESKGKDFRASTCAEYCLMARTWPI